VRAREVLIVAAEPSADLHAAGFVSALQARLPEVRIRGIGGPLLAALGAHLEARSESMAVMGFTEVVSHIPMHWRLLRTFERRLQRGDVGLVTLIDYPGFNMKLAAAAHRARVPVLYYITPQVWAWGRGRLHDLAGNVTKAACILPFEEQLLRAHGIDATFVGHPLLDRARTLPSRSAARAALGVSEDVRMLAVFPGSREQELRRHLDDAIATARLLESRIPGLTVVVSAATNVGLRGDDVPYAVVRGQSYTVLRAADAALCKSGTTTLEAAVCGCPLAVVYRTGRLTYGIARRFVRIPHVALVNVVAGRAVAPEFIQDAFRPHDVARALEPLLHDTSPERERMLDDLAAVRGQLGTPGAAERVAAMAVDLLGSS
jgi:lipid-A-disaccharide synthase